jgi:hypothetical protein
MGELVGRTSTTGDKDASLSTPLSKAEAGVAALQALVEPELIGSDFTLLGGVVRLFPIFDPMASAATGSASVTTCGELAHGSKGEGGLSASVPPASICWNKPHHGVCVRGVCVSCLCHVCVWRTRIGVGVVTAGVLVLNFLCSCTVLLQPLFVCERGEFRA